MSFSQSITTCLSKYAVFSGRASRAEYWWFFLFYTLAYLVAIVIDSTLGTPFVFTALALLVLIVPAIAAGIRRLHDTGRSGWWYLVTLIPFVGGIWLLVLLAQPGTPGPNQYDAAAAAG
jgi:uncharacterized membrane protein YhaH (DUF805 family)